MFLIAAYDIANPKRLNRIAKIMKDYGVRVQKSIFQVSVTESVFQIMKRRIEKEMVHAEDGVKFFLLCEKCEATREVIGLGVFVDPDMAYEIV